MLEALKLQQEQTKTLALENAQLRERISLDSTARQTTIPEGPSRGRLALRGKVVGQRKKGVPRLPPLSRTAHDSDDSDAEDDIQNTGGPAVYLSKSNCTTPELKKARVAIQVLR